MEEYQLIFNALLSIFIGLLLGIERERARKSLGIRTFPLSSLLGFSLFYLSEIINNFLPFVIGLIGLSILISIHHLLEYDIEERTGLTTEVAFLVTYVLGGIVYYNLVLALAGSIIALALLSLKEELHGFARGVKTEEILDLVKFGILLFIIYPIIPDKDFVFWNFEINFREVWLMVIVISIINFVGYVLTKLFGRKGLVMAGISGGLISSTAVTLSVSPKVREDPSLEEEGIGAINGATAMKYLRVLVLSSVGSFLVTQHLLPYLLTGFLIAFMITLYLYKKVKSKTGTIEMKSPFNIKEALEFGILYGVIKIGLQVLNKYFGFAGIILTSILTGFTDVDAITLSLSTMAGKQINLNIAIAGILLAVISNNIIKGLYSFAGGKRFGVKTLISLLIQSIPFFILIAIVLM